MLKSPKPKAENRPADDIGTPGQVVQMATGKRRHTGNSGKTGKNKAAVELGRRGGNARAKNLSAERRREIARKAASARWGRQDSQAAPLESKGSDRYRRL
jgi:hypothetical protein